MPVSMHSRISCSIPIRRSKSAYMPVFRFARSESRSLPRVTRTTSPVLSGWAQVELQ
jgi:hypothetical protein